MQILDCPHCHTQVVPCQDGQCPPCRQLAVHTPWVRVHFGPQDGGEVHDHPIAHRGRAGGIHRLANLGQGPSARTLEHGDSVFCEAYSTDGRMLASGSFHGTIKLWDVRKGSEIRTVKGSGAGVRSVAFSPDGQTLASGSRYSLVKFWSVQSGAEMGTVKGKSGEIESVCMWSCGGYAVAGWQDRDG